jgi:hypothetical protein
MSHTITLYCRCLVYVACHPHTGTAHTRVIERRDPLCTVRKHEVGLRLALWELLPAPSERSARVVLYPPDRDRLRADRA